MLSKRVQWELGTSPYHLLPPKPTVSGVPGHRVEFNSPRRPPTLGASPRRGLRWVHDQGRGRNLVSSSLPGQELGSKGPGASPIGDLECCNARRVVAVT